MKKEYTNFKKEIFTSIDQVYSEADTLLSIVNGYLYKYKIFNDADRQDIVGDIILEINKRIESQSLSAGYIHRIIKSNILLFLRPVVKEISFQLEDGDDFAKDKLLDNDSSTEDHYHNYQLLKEYLPTKWLELDKVHTNGDNQTSMIKNYKHSYKDFIWWMVKHYDQLDKIFLSTNFNEIIKINDFPKLYVKNIQMHYLFKKVFKNEENALFWRYMMDYSKEEILIKLNLTEKQFRNIQYTNNKFINNNIK